MFFDQIVSFLCCRNLFSVASAKCITSVSASKIMFPVKNLYKYTCVCVCLLAHRFRVLLVTKEIRLLVQGSSGLVINGEMTQYKCESLGNMK